MALEKKVGNKVVLANMLSNLGLHDEPGQPPTTPLSNIRDSELNRRGPPSVLQRPNKGHLNDSWRRPEGSKAREGSRVPGSKRAPGLEGYTRRPKDTYPRANDKIHTAEEYKEGVIFSTPVHETKYNQNIQVAMSKVESKTNLGWVSSKFRKYTVVKRFAKHVVALPVYTHDGRGLRYTTNKEQHISIRQVGKEKPAAAETVHGKLG
jgi:hypothetical protein